MSKPYDATSKDLIETDPAGWVTFLGCPAPAAAVSLVDADVSTVTADADKVIRVDHSTPWLLHLEIQANTDDTLPRRVLRYNALLQYRHALPVASVVVMLRPAGALSGQLRTAPPVGAAWDFVYDVLRVWDRPVGDFLSAPLGLLPLALLADVRQLDLAAVVARMKARTDREAAPPLAGKLWTAAYVLSGLRYEQALIDNLLSGVMQMEESVTYQAIMGRGMATGKQLGRTSEALAFILRQGRKKFGLPTVTHEAALNAIEDVDRLEALGEKLLDVATWDELLAAD